MKRFQRILSTLLLGSILTFQLPSIAYAGSAVPITPSPSPAPASQPHAKHPGLTALYIVAGAALLTLLYVSAHNQCERDSALCACPNDNENQLIGDTARRPPIGLALRVSI